MKNKKRKNYKNQHRKHQTLQPKSKVTFWMVIERLILIEWSIEKGLAFLTEARFLMNEGLDSLIVLLHQIEKVFY